MKMILLQQMVSPVIFKPYLMNIPKAMKRNIHLKTISHKLILTSKNQGTKIMHFCKFGLVPTKNGHLIQTKHHVTWLKLDSCLLVTRIVPYDSSVMKAFGTGWQDIIPGQNTPNGSQSVHICAKTREIDLLKPCKKSIPNWTELYT